MITQITVTRTFKGRFFSKTRRLYLKFSNKLFRTQRDFSYNLKRAQIYDLICTYDKFKLAK